MKTNNSGMTEAPNHGFQAMIEELKAGYGCPDAKETADFLDTLDRGKLDLDTTEWRGQYSRCDTGYAAAVSLPPYRQGIMTGDLSPQLRPHLQEMRQLLTQGFESKRPHSFGILAAISSDAIAVGLGCLTVNLSEGEQNEATLQLLRTAFVAYERAVHRIIADVGRNVLVVCNRSIGVRHGACVFRDRELQRLVDETPVDEERVAAFQAKLLA